MQTGKLRHRIQVQTDTPSTDTTGQAVSSWGTTDTVWGEIKPLSGDELMVARQVTPQVTHEITLRHRALVASQRLRDADDTSRVFNIKRVLNVGDRDKELRVLVVEEGV